MAQKIMTASAVYAAEFAGRLRIPDCPQPHLGYSFIIRALDIVISLILLVLSLPIMLLAALAIKLDSRGVVLFRQRRLGLKGIPFICFKFRTMDEGAHKRRDEVKEALHISGTRVKVRHDPRITRVGRVLRRFSIDEFPQLFNVLNGSMSLVGPRPLPIEELEECTPEQLQRLAVKPGLTCTWQVSGRAELDMDTHMQMDLDYIASRSLWKDLCILARTPWAVIGGRGAF